MVYSLLFSLPGTPALFYGEEIGMGENLDVPGRMAVRTPMQWSREPNGGFSPVRPSQLCRPVVADGFSPQHVNVADQRRDPDSMLAFMTLLIRRYRDSPELGWATFQVLDQPHTSVLAHVCTWDDGSLVALHNLSPDACEVPLRLKGCDDSHRLEDLLQDGTTQLDEKGRTTIALDGYGYRWLRVVAAGSRRLV
jgi:glycosidase